MHAAEHQPYAGQDVIPRTEEAVPQLAIEVEDDGGGSAEHGEHDRQDIVAEHDQNGSDQQLAVGTFVAFPPCC